METAEARGAAAADPAMASDEVALSSLLFVAAGVFAGLDVSCSSGSDFLALRVAMFFSRDFLPGGFVLGLGVGARRRFDFCDPPPAFGVSRGVASDDADRSRDSESASGFAWRGCGDSLDARDSLSSTADCFFAPPAGAAGLGDFCGFEDGFSSPDPKVTGFAFGMADEVSSGVAERCFVAVAGFVFPVRLEGGLGDLCGFGEAARRVLLVGSPGPVWRSSSTCARRRLPRIAPEASAVRSQIRMRTIRDGA